MKKAIPAGLLFLVILIFTSCSKESNPTLLGEWVSTASYNAEGWHPIPSRYGQTLQFHADSRFNMFYDTPAATGTYQFNRAEAHLDLNIEADPGGSGRGAMQIHCTISEFSEDRIVLDRAYLTDEFDRIEYSRVHD